MRALFNGQVIAESEDLVEVEGNQYFPRAALSDEFLVPSDHTSFCRWKGTANYFSVKVGDEIAQNSVWFYADPMQGAEMVAGRVGFWKGVTVEP